MLVYRICREEEKNTFSQEKSFLNCGKIYQADKRKSTHTYQEDKKYLHFFKNYDGVFFLNTTKNHYICTYDIKDSILEETEGIGYYWDRISFKSIEKVPEYAIATEKLSFDDLIQIDEITEDIDFEEYVDTSFQEKIKTIYLKQENKKLVKRND